MNTIGASLSFRCGMSDLPLTQHGWMHLPEHLALHGEDAGGPGLSALIGADCHRAVTETAARWRS
jgi:hypothetical protein